jgi:class 3 adenylate cyclase
MEDRGQVTEQRLEARDRFTLRFLDDALERELQEALGTESLARTRRGPLQAAALWSAVGAVLPFIVTERLSALEAVVGFGVLINLVGWAILSRGTPSFDRQQATIGVINALANVGSMAILLLAGGDFFLRYGAPGIMLATAFGQLIVRLRFITALLTSAPSLIGYVIAAGFFLPRSALIADAFLVSAMFAVVALSSYALEVSVRELFWQRRVIAAQALALEREKEKSDRLLLNVLPRSVAGRLRESHASLAESFDSATVLFADIVGFTRLAARVPAPELVALLDELFSRFDDLAERHGLEKIKTIGDAYMVVGGVPERCDDHPSRVAAMGLDMIAAVAEFARVAGHPLALRVGIHTGQVVAGVIGKKKFAYDLWGDTVNTASRMESHGAEGRVHISEACSERLRGEFVLTARGAIEIKGKGEMRTWFLDGKRA